MTPWTEIAGHIARKSGDLPIDEQVWDFLKSLPEERPVLIACSGGADSVLLLLLLLARLPDARARLHVCHFNHRLRGTAADADARFVEDMATALGLPASIGCAENSLPASEAALRTARYDWLAGVYSETGAGALCLGHHADDVLESQLMALFTGSGPAGLGAPLPLKRFADGHVRLRPLIGWRKPEIEHCLRSVNAQWRDDATNQDRSYTRNWIRQELIPLVKKNFPQDPHAGSKRTRRLMAEAVEAVDAVLGRLNVNLSNPDRFPASLLVGQPHAVIRRGLLAWWLRHRPEERLEPAAVELLVQSISLGCRDLSVSIGAGRVLAGDTFGDLAVRPEVSSTEPQWTHPICWSWASGPLFLPNGGSLQGERVSWDAAQPAPYLKADPARETWLGIEYPILSIRQWQPGDRYRPMGAPGNRKLQDIFTDAKLEPEQKHRLPVLLFGTDILWVPGFPPAEAVKVTASAKSALKLTYTP